MTYTLLTKTFYLIQQFFQKKGRKKEEKEEENESLSWLWIIN